MALIYVDNKSYEVPDGQNLLQACLSLGFNLPYFCWHPALGSVGACRQCAVKQFKDEHDTRGKIVMACMTPAANNTRISINDLQARQFRASVIEWLMVNHPHDCPVCDEGGECHLQDMTVMTGHDYREFRFLKRTHRDQYLGPFVNHEMNRCIACYRCVRYYRDYADGRDFDVFGAHDHVYFGRHTDGVLENKFSGNLVEVCPTGVFTDKTLKKHYTRKWDLQTAPSICVHCGVGCNTIPGERYGMVRRIRNRYHEEVNGYFLCDRGRYGYEFVNHPNRIRGPLLRAKSQDPLKPVGVPEALARLGLLLADRSKVIGIGSPRASLESNFALQALVGPERFFWGVPAAEAELTALALQLLRQSPARSASLKDASSAEAVFILGEDVLNYAPMLALALRQAARREPLKAAAKLKLPAWHAMAVLEVIQDRKGPFYIASAAPVGLDDLATKVYRAAPDELARLGFAVAHALDNQAPTPQNLADDVQKLAAEIAAALKSVTRPLVVSGPGCGSKAVMLAAANITSALIGAGHPAQLTFTAPECNSFGLPFFGGPGLEAAFSAGQAGQVETVIVLENDLFRRAEAAVVKRFLNAFPHVVVLDHLVNATTEAAEVVLPASTFAESSGTFVNNEGRAQRFYEVFVPAGDVQASWRWLADLGAGNWKNLDAVLNAIAQTLPDLQPVTEIAPPANFTIAGQKIAREPHRFSGRTAMFANLNVHEPKPPEDRDSPLAYTMEGYHGIPPSPLIPRFWMPGWNSIQALNKFQQEVGGPLRGGDPGRRLIEPATTGAFDYYREIPPPFVRRPGEWLLIPLYHVFGSDELSMLTPGIAELAPKPCLTLNPEDAATLAATEGTTLKILMNQQSYRLPLKVLPGLPPGLAGFPIGLPQAPVLTFPAWAKIEKENPA